MANILNLRCNWNSPRYRKQPFFIVLCIERFGKGIPKLNGKCDNDWRRSNEPNKKGKCDVLRFQVKLKFSFVKEKNIFPTHFQYITMVRSGLMETHGFHAQRPNRPSVFWYHTGLFYRFQPITTSKLHRILIMEFYRCHCCSEQRQRKESFSLFLILGIWLIQILVLCHYCDYRFS